MQRPFELCVGLVPLMVFFMLGASEPVARGGDDAEYVGTKSCKKCHFEIWESWSKTKMAGAFHVLLPDSKLEPGKKTGLTAEWIAEIKANKARGDPKIEPGRNYTREADCVKCHVTGYGEPGGYAIPDPKNKKAARKAKKLEGVGCEACHGPGSKYVKIFEEIQEKQRPYTRDELYAAGMTEVDKEGCLRCHTKESPLVGDDFVFDFDKLKDQGTHKHVEMKLRKD